VAGTTFVLNPSFELDKDSGVATAPGQRLDDRRRQHRHGLKPAIRSWRLTI